MQELLRDLLIHANALAASDDQCNVHISNSFPGNDDKYSYYIIAENGCDCKEKGPAHADPSVKILWGDVDHIFACF